MKNFFLVLSFCLGCSLLSGQTIPSAQVPGYIRDSLHGKFPNAQSIQWTHSGSNYEAKFATQNGRNTEVTYNSTGNWQRIAYQRIQDSLFTPVKQALSSQYSGYAQKSTQRVLRRGQSSINLIILEKAGKETRLEMDDSGHVLKVD